MRIEEEFEDVFQNLEFIIVRFYGDFPDLSDHGVIRVLEAVADSYAAEVVGRPPRSFGLSLEEQELFVELREICDWRLGRKAFETADGTAREVEPIAPDELKLCLRRLLKSVRMWNREGGPRGYLDFVSGFF